MLQMCAVQDPALMPVRSHSLTTKKLQQEQCNEDIDISVDLSAAPYHTWSLTYVISSVLAYLDQRLMLAFDARSMPFRIFTAM
jgi:hypothetical protein